jgi:hypothetical protein
MAKEIPIRKNTLDLNISRHLSLIKLLKCLPINVNKKVNSVNVRALKKGILFSPEVLAN